MALTDHRSLKNSRFYPPSWSFNIFKEVILAALSRPPPRIYGCVSMCILVYICPCSYEKSKMTKKRRIRFNIYKEKIYELFWLVNVYERWSYFKEIKKKKGMKKCISRQIRKLKNFLISGKWPHLWGKSKSLTLSLHMYFLQHTCLNFISPYSTLFSNNLLVHSS